ncbi:arylesterase [Burkholderia aenigmatica]|uniref:Arylesterase n=1 Tax=Burkholderia aenigmatica TaxID=2015348 RepID=A0A6J5IYB4_9BURK|nr:arylesterase [Burkholderia aenigmatica]
MGGGEVARYIGRHGTRHVAKSAVVGSGTPLAAPRDDHPEGTDVAASDGIRAGIVAGRHAHSIHFDPSTRPQKFVRR